MADTVSFIIELKDKFSKKLGKATAATDRFNNSMKKVTPSVGGFGKQMAGLVSIAAVGAVLVNTARDVMQFETAIGSLSAITGATGGALDELKGKVGEVAKNTKASSIEVAKAFEVVGSAKPQLLENADALANVTEQAIILSEASGMQLEESALALTGAMNQFGIGAEGAGHAIDVLANGAKFGAAAIPLVAQSIEKFGAVASGFNVSMEESVALTEALADKSLKGAEAGTALRAMLSKMETIKESPAAERLRSLGVDMDAVSDRTLSFQKRMEALSPIANDAGAKIAFFGETGKQAADIILSNTDRLGELTEKMFQSGAAGEQQAANNATLNKALEQLSNTWTNIFTSSSAAGSGLEIVRKIIVFITDNLETLVTVGATVLGFLAAFKIAMFAVNIAMAANPVGLIVAGILALVAAVTIIIVKYEEWGAALSLVLGPLGLLINLIQAFRRNWDGVVQSFKSGGILEGFKKIGDVILDALIMPMHQLFQLMRNLPGVGDLAGKIADKIKSIRKGLDVEQGGEQSSATVSDIVNKVVNPLTSAGAVPIASTTGTPLGAATSKAAENKTTIASAAPKTINLTIQQLVGEINNNNSTLQQNMAESADVIKQTLLAALNDVQTDLG